MDVHIKRRGRILLTALFVLLIGGIFISQTDAYADNSPFYFFINTGTPITELEITEETTVFIEGVLESDEVSWMVGDETIISASNGANATGKYSLRIQCNKPGTTTISGTVGRKVHNEVTGTEDILYTPLTLKVTVKLKINNYTNTPNNQGKVFHLFNENEEDQGSLVLKQGETFDLKLMVGEVHADDLSWYCDYDENTVHNIAKVNDRGQVTALNPGIAKVGVNTYKVSADNNQTVLQTDYIYVVVKPEFTDEKGTALSKLSLEDPTTIYTNARIAKNLSWVITDNSTNQVIVDTFANLNSDLVKLTPSAIDGSCKVDFKAGSYTVEVFPIYPTDSTLDLRVSAKYPSLELMITEYVQFDFLDDEVYVGDELDLYRNSNVADLSKFKVQGLANCDIDTDTFKVTFTQEGDAVIKITSLDNKLPIRPANASGWLEDFTVRTFPGTQSYTKRLNIGETFEYSTLLASVTPEEYVSLDKSIATVNTSGKVTAVKGGTTTVRAVVVTKGGILRYFDLIVIVNPGITATLDKSSLTMAVGETSSVYAAYTPNNMSAVQIKWVISNTDTKVVEIISNITTPEYVSIKAVAPGTVTLVLQDQNSKQLSFCNITVKQPITQITLDQTEVEKTLKSDASLNKFMLQAKFTPSNPTDDALVWTSSDMSVATVEQGVVTYKKAGTTTIRVAPAYQVNSSSVYAECKLTVYQQLNKLTLSDSTMTAYVGDAVKLSVSSYSPTQYIKEEDLALTWLTSNDSVVKITGATGFAPKMSAVGPGTATITVSSTSGVVASCKVTVYQYATEIKLSASKLTLDVGKTYSPVVTLSPKTLTDSSVSWESSNTSYVTVDKDGKITAKSAGKYGIGEAIVTATTSNGLRAYISVTTTQRVTGLSLNYEKKTVTKGKTTQLAATVEPSNAAEKEVTWKSSDSSVATVDKNGLVKGVKGGTALVTAISPDTGISKYCMVTVEEKVTKITLNHSTYNLAKGKTLKLRATVTSNYATNQKLKWSTSSKKIATVSSSGKVTAKGYGYATIKVKATDGSGASATCRIRVVRPVTKISLNKSSATLLVGRTLKLNATVKPSNATYKSVKWTSSDKQVAYVDSSGKVTAMSPGTVRITAKAKDNSGLSAVCVIKVEKETPVTGITIVNKNITLITGESQTLNYVAIPNKNSDKISWYSDDNQIASVNKKTGRITAHRPGTVTVTVAASSGKVYETKVTVVGLSKTTLTMEQYDTYTLKVINGKSVQWEVSDADIVKVSSSGKVSARKKGTTYVTAVVNGRTLRCKVIVKKIK